MNSSNEPAGAAKTALARRSTEQWADLLVRERFGEVVDDIGFSSNIFMVFGLPARRLKENPAFWTKKTSLCQLTMTRHPKYEIPWGPYARMNQIFIDTEVRTKNTNVIELGRSFREYAHKLGYQDGWANRALLRQLANYITSVIRVEPAPGSADPGRLMGVQAMVARAWDIHFDVENPDQLMLAKGQVILEERYAQYIHKHAVPLDMNVVHCFKRNPLALDFYRFLTYRNNTLRKAVSFPDRLLFQQLGTEQESDRLIRARLRRILRTLQMYWPVQAKFEDGYFELAPSPPAVQHRLQSKQTISIAQVAAEEVVHKDL
jgi:hypothetical protein